MTLNQLVFRAASAYDDALPLRYWDAHRQQPLENPAGGDSLARFVVHELAETFDPNEISCAQIAVAVRAMQAASDDLATVAHALGNLSREQQPAAA